MNIPSEIRAGDTVKWRDDSSTDVFGNEIKSTNGRSSNAEDKREPEAHTSTGTVFGTGWEFTIGATVTAEFDAGTWYWQAIATKGAESLTLGYGTLTVEASLSYTGPTTPKYDGAPGRERFRGSTNSNQDIDCWWRSTGIQDRQSQPEAL